MVIASIAASEWSADVSPLHDQGFQVDKIEFTEALAKSEKATQIRESSQPLAVASVLPEKPAKSELLEIADGVKNAAASRAARRAARAARRADLLQQKDADKDYVVDAAARSPSMGIIQLATGSGARPSAPGTGGRYRSRVTTRMDFNMPITANQFQGMKQNITESLASKLGVPVGDVTVSIVNNTGLVVPDAILLEGKQEQNQQTSNEVTLKVEVSSESSGNDATAAASDAQAQAAAMQQQLGTIVAGNTSLGGVQVPAQNVQATSGSPTTDEVSTSSSGGFLITPCATVTIMAFAVATLF